MVGSYYVYIPNTIHYILCAIYLMPIPALTFGNFHTLAQRPARREDTKVLLGSLYAGDHLGPESV